MPKSKEAGIQVPGGLVSAEPAVSKLIFGLRGLVAFMSGGENGMNQWFKKTPMFLVIWNTDRTEELYKEGPYGGTERSERLKTIVSQVKREGLGEFLLRNESVK